MRPPAQVLMDLMDKLTTLLTATVIPANQDEHNAEVAQIREEIAQAKEALAAEDTRLATERAALDARATASSGDFLALGGSECVKRGHEEKASVDSIPFTSDL